MQTSTETMEYYNKGWSMRYLHDIVAVYRAAITRAKSIDSTCLRAIASTVEPSSSN